MIGAGGAILTGIACAIVDRMLTVLSGVAGIAVALIAIDHVNTNSIILARINRAIVDVDVARSSSPSWMTNAFVLVQAIDTRSMLARFRHAQVNLLLTTFTSEAGWTSAYKVVDEIGAVGVQQARILSAIVGVDLTGLTFPAGQAVAFESSLQQSCA